MQVNYRNAAQRIALSPWVVPIFFLSILGVLLALIIYASDIRTNYEALARMDVNGFSDSWGKVYKIAVAGLPQIFGSLISYTVMGQEIAADSDPVEKRAFYGLWAILGILLSASIFFGYTFYIAEDYAALSIPQALGLLPGAPEGAPAAAIQAIFLAVLVDTLMSEFGLPFVFGLSLSLYPHYLEQRGDWREKRTRDYEAKAQADVAIVRADRARRDAKEVGRPQRQIN